MSARTLGVFIILISNKVRESGSSSSWQFCNDKCYFFGKDKMSFYDQKGYCKTMSGSTPVDLGSKMAQSIATFFQPCRISKSDKELYWINKESVLCRTIVFNGDDVLMNQNEQCTSTRYPVCENDKSFCNSNHELKQAWVQIAGKGLYYMLSRTEFTYCYAKYVCENSWNSQLFPGGNYTFMGLLGTELGITGRLKVQFWLDSPGVSCPTGNGEGTVMQYTGPYVHIEANKSANLQFKVLCMSDKPGTATITRLKTLQAYTLSSNTTHLTKLITFNTLPSTSTSAPTNKSTQTTHKSSARTRAPTTLITYKPSSSTQVTTIRSTRQRYRPSTIPRDPPSQSTEVLHRQTASIQAQTTIGTMLTHTPTTSNRASTTLNTTQRHRPSTRTGVPTTHTAWQTYRPSTSTKAPTTYQTRQTYRPSTSTRIPTNHTTPQPQRPKTNTRASTTLSEPQTHRASLKSKAPATHKTQQTYWPSTSTRAPTTQKTRQQYRPQSSHPVTTHRKLETKMQSMSTRLPSTIISIHTNEISSSILALTSKRSQVTQMTSLATDALTGQITQQSHTPTTSTDAFSTTPGTRWVKIGQEEYYVNTIPLNYHKASQYCHDRMNSSLAMFLDPLNYFSVLGRIEQVALLRSSFWVGAHGLDTRKQTNDCLSFNNINMTLTTWSCDIQSFSLCRRVISGDFSNVLENPEFKTMIREMTVLKNGTKKRMSKLTSAQDGRPSSEAAGGVGVFIICSVIVVMLMSDCSGVRSSFFTKKIS